MAILDAQLGHYGWKTAVRPTAPSDTWVLSESAFTNLQEPTAPSDTRVLSESAFTNLQEHTAPSDTWVLSPLPCAVRTGLYQPSGSHTAPSDTWVVSHLPLLSEPAFSNPSNRVQYSVPARAL